MSDLIEDFGFVVPVNDPEPDPNDKPATWCQWFRRLSHVSLPMAANALKIRKAEWSAMDSVTKHPAPGPVAPAAVVPTSAPLNDGKALG